MFPRTRATRFQCASASAAVLVLGGHGGEVARYYDSNTPWTQCAIVNFVFKLADCCGPAGSVQPCNGECGVDSGIGASGHFDHNELAAADYDIVRGEINAGRPMGIWVSWATGGVHCPAIGGYWDYTDITGLHPIVHVEDPGYGPSDVWYSDMI
jgi:hypothetical protein